MHGCHLRPRTNTTYTFSASLYLGLPATDWKTGYTVCTLATKTHIDESADLSNITQILNTQANKRHAWTGTRVKYSKWTVFIGKIKCIINVE